MKVCDCKTNQNTVRYCSLKKAPTCHLEGEKNHITPAAENTLSQLCQNTKKTAKTRLKSHCQPLQVKLQVGAKHRTRIKNLLKTWFQKKSDCFWNNPPSFLLKNTTTNKINNSATQQPWKKKPQRLSNVLF